MVLRSSEQGEVEDVDGRDPVVCGVHGSRGLARGCPVGWTVRHMLNARADTVKTQSHAALDPVPPLLGRSRGGQRPTAQRDSGMRNPWPTWRDPAARTRAFVRALGTANGLAKARYAEQNRPSSAGRAMVREAARRPGRPGVATRDYGCWILFAGRRLAPGLARPRPAPGRSPTSAGRPATGRSRSRPRRAALRRPHDGPPRPAMAARRSR
jgi:hypothetical protein